MRDLDPPGGAESALGELLDAVAVPAWLHRSALAPRANLALQRLCGLTPEVLQCTTHLALVADEDRAALALATDECLHGSGEPPAQAARLLTGLGSQRPVELTLRRVRWGDTPAALVTCIDHSDFQHVQSMLLAASNQLREIVDGAPVASFVIDRDHRVTHWNSACERLTGYPAEQMLGSTESWRAFYDQARPLLADLVVKGVDPAELATWYGDKACRSSLIAGAYEAETHFPGMGPDGRWLNFTAAPLGDQRGRVIGAIVTLQDVSQRRRNEDELTRRLEQMVKVRSVDLAASARVMDAFIDNAPIGVFYVNREQVQRSNRQMGEIFGLPKVKSIDQPAQNFYLSDDDAAELARQAIPQLSRGLPLHHEMRMQHRSGRPLWIQVNAITVDHRSHNGGTWWMLQDRSEMRAAQQALAERFAQLQTTHHQLEQTQNQLLQADKMASIGQLAAGVAHEINNPVGFVSSNLNTLRQYVESLLALVDAYAAARQAPTSLDAAAQLARALAAAELDYLKKDLPQLLDENAEGLSRVKKIVQDLKDFSRVDPSDWQDADLNAGLESTLNVVRHELKYKAEVIQRLAPLPLVRCLAGQLNQVFMNLIVNASQAISGHGQITLSSGAQQGWAWVQVDDTGCGMSEAVQRRVFEPFYTTKDVGQGTGLGLSLSFAIVKRHGGLMRLRSAPGEGSSFRVWVPVGGPPPDPADALGDPSRTTTATLLQPDWP